MSEKVSIPYTTIVGFLALSSVLVGGSLASSRQKLLRQLKERERMYTQRYTGMQAQLQEARGRTAALDQQVSSLNRDLKQLRARNGSLEAEVGALRRAKQALEALAAVDATLEGSPQLAMGWERHAVGFSRRWPRLYARTASALGRRLGLVSGR